MGNVVSAILMYALEAAWVFQRFWDQDYSQNHGSRVTPVSSGDADCAEVFLPNGASTPILSRSPHHHSKPAAGRASGGGHKKTRSEPIEMTFATPPRLPRERTRRRSSSFRARRRHTPDISHVLEKRARYALNHEGPETNSFTADGETTEWTTRLHERFGTTDEYFPNSAFTHRFNPNYHYSCDTNEWVTRHRPRGGPAKIAGLRRAYSEINLSAARNVSAQEQLRHRPRPRQASPALSLV